MAGLVAARMLSEHFDEVIVVERDLLLDAHREPRKGVPQGRHTHVLLARGEQLLSALFPGLVPALLEDGALSVDLGQDLAWFHFGGWKARTESGVHVLSVSRPLLESHVRRRVFALPGVRRLDGCEVLGLRTSPDRQRLTGITFRRREADQPEQLDAELVVEACGRGSRLPAWLEELGYPRPEETSVKVLVGNATRQYRRPEPSPYPWKGLYILGTPPESRRLGTLLPVEGGRWIASFAGMLGDYPPSDPEGFLAFAKSLPDDSIYRVLRDAEPLTDIETYKFPAHLRRHYERMDRLPEGLVVVGDAFVSFNPLFGQGMTTACLGVMALDRCLSEQRRHRGGDLTGLARRYHAAAAKATLPAWLMSTGEDFRAPEVEGQRPFLYPALRWYTGQVHRAARADREVYVGFIRTMQMLAGPEALFNPRMVLRVLRAARATPVPYPFPEVAPEAPGRNRASTASG